MKRAVILVAPGFEESETLTIADILRRAEISCELAGTEREVTGSHGITVQCDRLIEKDIISCDMVILPGGYESTAALQKDPLVLEILREMAKKGKYVSAMCAAPLFWRKQVSLTAEK
jgi:4-methyl-5(b-hydroxyethyl)-thiazole monophosphate biosynthesis